MIRQHFKIIESTNNWAKENITQCSKNTITLVTAEQQTGGRGRFGRKWHSPPGTNLYGTFVFFMEESKIELSSLVQLLAISATKILEERNFKPSIKWPNDILINSKKLAGILCETISLPEDLSLIGVVLGIGININMPIEELSKVDQPATSLLAESGKQWDVEAITQALAVQLEKDIKTQKLIPF